MKLRILIIAMLFTFSMSFGTTLVDIGSDKTKTSIDIGADLSCVVATTITINTVSYGMVVQNDLNITKTTSVKTVKINGMQTERYRLVNDVGLINTIDNFSIKKPPSVINYSKNKSTQTYAVFINRKARDSLSC